MSSPLGQYGSKGYESSESRTLGKFASDKFSYREQAKNIIQLNNAVGYMSAYMRKMQRGIDEANQNFIQQIQGLLNDFGVLIGGGGDTGFEFGDFKFVVQAIGALFGFGSEDGTIQLPINLFEAAWYFFSSYILPSGDFESAINMIVDSMIASILDIFGEVPILGQALQQLAVIISSIRDAVLLVNRVINDIVKFLGNAPFGDPSFDLFASVENFIGSILYPSGKIFTEWDLFNRTGGLEFPAEFPADFGSSAVAGDGGLEFPAEFPADFGSLSLGKLQRWILNLQNLLTADYSSETFNLISAIETFVETRLLPTGLFAAFSDIQNVIEAVAGSLGAGLTDVINRLQHLSVGGGQFDAAQLLNIFNIPTLDDSSVPGLQDIKDAIWEGINYATGSNTLLSDLITAIRNIPSVNVLGAGGPINVLQSFYATWDQLVGGLVGVIGTGASLADIYNIAQQVSSNAFRGLLAFDIAGIRNNTSFDSGFLPTSQSNFKYSKVSLGSTTMPTFPVTQSTAITAYYRVLEENDIGVISFEGSGVTGLTAAFLNVFKMDLTNGLSTLVHQSNNILGLLSSTVQKTRYELPTPIHGKPGEVYGCEVTVRGTGTYNIVGLPVGSPNDPDVFPRNWSSVRNAGTLGPPTIIAHSALVYATNVYFMEMGISLSDPGLPRSPQIQSFSSVGTISVVPPDWANIIQVVINGPGGGGRQGGTFGFYGAGGLAGQWITATWVKGIDFTGIPTITIVIPPGGAGGSSGLGYGDDAGNATVSIPGHTITAVGGTGATSQDFGSGNAYGRSPGNIVFDGTTYVGGLRQNNTGSPGAAPGGGGSGGDGALFQFGGNGAPAAAWLRFKSS